MNVSWSGRRIVAIVATMQVALPSAEVIDLPVDLVSSTLLTADAPQIGHSISYKQPPLCWTGPPAPLTQGRVGTMYNVDTLRPSGQVEEILFPADPVSKTKQAKEGEGKWALPVASTLQCEDNCQAISEVEALKTLQNMGSLRKLDHPCDQFFGVPGFS